MSLLVKDILAVAINTKISVPSLNRSECVVLVTVVFLDVPGHGLTFSRDMTLGATLLPFYGHLLP